MAYIFEQDGDYVNFNGGSNLYRLHKDSNCIAWHWDQTGDLFFDVYDLQFTVKAENIGSVTVGGHVLTTAADFGTYIVQVFTGLGSGSPGSASYLVYTALITQTSTDAPVATVLENTLGGPVVWGRFGVGQYTATLAGAFTLNKTTVVPFGDNQLLSFIGLGSSLPFDYGYSIRPNTTDAVLMEVYKTSDWSAAELSTISAGIKIHVEIRVYP